MMIDKKGAVYMVLVVFTLYPAALLLNLIIDEVFYYQQLRWSFIETSRRTIFDTAVQDWLRAMVWSLMWMLNFIVWYRIKHLVHNRHWRTAVLYFLPLSALLYAIVFQLPLLALLMCLGTVIATAGLHMRGLE